MKKLVLFLGIALLCSFSLSSISDSKQQQNVWVCSSSTTYHKSTSCIDMKNCSGAKKSVTITEAKQTGKKACPICYPQKNTTNNQGKKAVKRSKNTTNNNSASNSTNSNTQKKAVKRTRK